jgi:hypothetical protein
MSERCQIRTCPDASTINYIAYFSSLAQRSRVRHRSRRATEVAGRQIDLQATPDGRFSALRTTKRFDSFKSRRGEIATRGAASMLREQSVVYHPEELSLLGHILDQAIESLPATMRTPYHRTEIAKSLLASAATGERDPIKLELAAGMIDLNVSTAA